VPDFVKAARNIGLLAVPLLIVGCIGNSGPQSAGTSNLESKIFNARFWPKEASRLVRTGEPAKECVDTGGLVFVVNNEDSLIFMNDGKFYINELQWSCSNVLVSGAVLDAGFGRRQLCEGVSVTLQDRFGGFDNAQCYLGKFTPLRLATQADAQQSNTGETIVLNEGQDIRRAQVRRRQR